MNICYIPDISGNLVFLDENESAHIVRVLRMGNGDALMITNGKGILYEAVITDAHPRKCVVRLERTVPDAGIRNYRLTIAVAPTKNADRMEWFTEKAVEIGIDSIVPMVCQFSERRILNISRLEKIAVAAMKQSQKAWLPAISDMVPFRELISEPFDGVRLIAHCYQGEKPHLSRVIKPGDNVLILVGPEGDFSPEEVSMAKEAGFTEVSLGRSRLRTETAALVACHSVALANEPG